VPSFVRGRTHTVEIWIGDRVLAAPGVVVADHDFAESAVESDGDAARLEVTFAHRRDTSTRTITLPVDRTRPSTRAEFELEVEVDEQVVVATITVEQRTRVLQQAVLVGVTSVHADGGADTPITLTVQLSARPIEDTTSVMHFDASVTTPLADAPSIVKAGGVATVPLPWHEGLREELTTIGDRLFTTAKTQAGAAGSNSAWPSLVRFLALHGKTLHTWLMDNGYEELQAAATVQLTDADPSRPLPVELVYDRDVALDAVQCAGWDAALATGRCPSCDAAPADKRVICPLGFWGLSKVIERQTGKIATVARELAPITGVVFAASNAVRAEDVATTLDTLNSVFSTAPIVAHTWKELEERVVGGVPRPGLIVLMPHHGHDQENEIDYLEIGAADALLIGQVHANHVHALDAPGPLVLLLGCKTADSSTSYLNFVAEFRQRGAAVVVGTIATVLGRDIAPVAQRFVADLSDAAHHTGASVRIGTVLLSARRHLVARQNAAAFAVVAFGDADLLVKGV
jgi:hypothetical protein